MGAKIKGGDLGEDSLESEINIIPLVDIMLVLLIIFMIAAPMMYDTVDINLPQAQAQQSDASEESVILAIQKDRKLFIGRQEISFEELSMRIRAIFENRDRKEIYIRADEEVSHGFVIQVMARIQQAGISRMAFETDPSRQ
ncbi:MAG: biopolymer transporter ExbD [Bradymonadales bacterium]|nr:MAG: biopolymer transporter ExbD [Bradymonadales bacterium]